MSKKARIKTAAITATFANRFEVDAAIAQIGAAQRARNEIETAMNAELAAVKAKHEALAVPHAAVIAEMAEGVRVWCEAHRIDLTKEGKTKTAKFAAGEVSWRMRPWKVTIRGEGIVIETLKEQELGKFIRTTEAVDKNKLLLDRDAVKGVKGISFSQGEDFVIKPFASEIEEVRS